MPTPSPDQFWTLLVESRLADAGTAGTLRREFEGLPFPPGATAAAATEVIARWLVKRAVISDWQARRLLRGEKGPYFLGDYRLLDREDNGRGGSVFRARHDPTGRIVGITALNNRHCQKPEVWSDILKRTKAATEAKDPTLTKTWALEKAGSQRFVLSEDPPGVPLAEEVAARGPIPAAEAASIVLAVARAVAELHRLGVVHGGISLDTVRREAPATGARETDGTIRLAQFPLVADPHVVPPRPELTDPDAVARLGTRASFLPPEALRPGRISDTAGDVYALGVLFHSLLTGVPACWQGDPPKTLAHVAAGGRPAVLPGETVPVEVATLVSYLTARDPAERYPTAAEAADAIAACIGKPPVSPSLPEQRPMITEGSGPGDGARSAGSEPILVIAADPPAATASRRKSRPRWLLPALGGLGLLAVSVIAALLLLRPAPRPDSPAGQGKRSESAGDRVERRGDDDPGAGAGDASGAAEARPADSDPPVVTTLVDAAPGTEGVPFQPPQPAGSPPRLAYLAPGSQLVLLARPADALATDEGRLFVRSLGPRGAEAVAAVERMSGCAIEQIAEIQAGWQAGGPDEVVGAVLVRGVDRLPVDADERARADAFGPTRAEEIGGETLHVGASISAWMPSDGDGRLLVIGPEDLVRATIAARPTAAGGGGAGAGIEASLPRDLEELVAMLDATRHLTIFGSPDYLLHDGRPVLAGPLAKLADPLAWFFGDAIRASALQLHFGPDCYLELDAVAPAGTPPRQLAERFSGRIAAMADAVEEYCNALDPHPYGRKLVMRLPRMLGVLADQIHAGADGRGVIVNAWLPEHAPHNIALAAELALEQTPQVSAGGVAATAARPAGAAGAAGALAKPISLTFAKDTLEKSIQMIAEEIGVEMEILGNDLQLEGITKNQSFGIDERDRPAAEILRTILARANPDGKLVYVIRRGERGERIEITTRAAAEKRGDTLAPGQNAPDNEEASGAR